MTEGILDEGTAFAEGHGEAPEEAVPAKRTLKPGTRRALIVIAVVAVIMALTLLFVYFIQARKYVTTDNAQIDGDKISVNAPNSGTLVDWTATQGTQLVKDRVVGRIRIQGGFVQPQVPIRAPGAGTIAVDNGVEGAFVTAGTTLAVAYDFSKIFVTARVDETDIDDVHAGQRVDIDVDAFPNAGLIGTVTEVQGGAAGEFSAFPQSNTAGNYQKVTQVIPVKITIDDTKGLALVPGMNTTVKIHKDD
jgi:multidrug resistance efflux pump